MSASFLCTFPPFTWLHWLRCLSLRVGFCATLFIGLTTISFNAFAQSSTGHEADNTLSLSQQRALALQACCDAVRPRQWEQALRLGTQLATQGDATGYYVLAHVYGTPKQLYFDAFKAQLSVQRAIELGSVPALYLYGAWLFQDDTTTQIVTQHDVSKGLQLIEQAASKGLLEAQLFLADYYDAFNPDWDAPQLERVGYWFEQASQHDAYWRQELVALADYALKTLKQPQQALSFYKTAQRLGEPHINELLADLYADDAFGKQQRPQALTYYEQAALEENSPQLKARLGEWFLNGELGMSNLEKGRYWLTQAAEQGNAAAMLSLATLYEKHLNQPTQALAWYEAYAEQQPDAWLYYKLADWLEHGTLQGRSVINTDANKALGYYQKASQLGSLKATRKLGFYYKSTHTASSLQQACYYFSKAAQQGDGLSQQHLREAKQLLAACPLFPPPPSATLAGEARTPSEEPDKESGSQTFWEVVPELAPVPVRSSPPVGINVSNATAQQKKLKKPTVQQSKVLNTPSKPKQVKRISTTKPRKTSVTKAKVKVKPKLKASVKR